MMGLGNPLSSCSSRKSMFRAAFTVTSRFQTCVEGMLAIFQRISIAIHYKSVIG